MKKVHYKVRRSRQQHPDWWTEIGDEWDYLEAMNIARKYKQEHRTDNVQLIKVTEEYTNIEFNKKFCTQLSSNI